jgi:hypothetical protein
MQRSIERYQHRYVHRTERRFLRRVIRELVPLVLPRYAPRFLPRRSVRSARVTVQWHRGRIRAFRIDYGRVHLIPRLYQAVRR